MQAIKYLSLITSIYKYTLVYVLRFCMSRDRGRNSEYNLEHLSNPNLLRATGSSAVIERLLFFHLWWKARDANYRKEVHDEEASTENIRIKKRKIEGWDKKRIFLKSRWWNVTGSWKASRSYILCSSGSLAQQRVQHLATLSLSDPHLEWDNQLYILNQS